MTAVVLWKEYRQQRAIWVAIAVLAFLLVISTTVFQTHGSRLEDMKDMLQRDRHLRDSLNLGFLCLAISYGVVSGALLLASETEVGTIVFLDCLTGWRAPVWTRKFLAGVLLTLSMSVTLVVLSLILGFGYWENTLTIPLCALDALVWGMLGGAMCRNVLAAVLTGIAFIAVSWFPWPVVDSIAAFALVKMAIALVGCYASRRRFSVNDRLRQLAAEGAVIVDGWDPASEPATERLQPTKRAKKRTRTRSGFFSSLRAVVWLSFRQGRWLLAFCLVGTFLFAFAVHTAPLVLWPMGTLALGLLCGLSVFVHDQKEGVHFLGAQRFPPGRVWLPKLLFWGGVLVALVTLAWLLDIAGGLLLYPDSSVNNSEYRGHRWFDDLGKRAELIPSYVFLGLWPLYGFCFGQFFAQVLRRPVIAAILAVFVTPAIVSLWVPSLLFGGVPVWQLLLLPVLLLALTRWTQRPWLADRLYNFWPLVRLSSGVALMNVTLAGCLWYRAVEVPDLDEPFNIQAFKESMPPVPPKENEPQAGALIRKAAASMNEWRNKVETKEELGSLQVAIFPQPPGGGLRPQLPPGVGMPGVPIRPGMQQLPEQISYQYQALLLDITVDGWPKQDKEAVSIWLNRVCEGEWFQELQEAAKLPMGVVFDARLATAVDPRQLNATGFGTLGKDCPNMGRLLVARAYQLQAYSDSDWLHVFKPLTSRAALDCLETALALSRHMKNNAPVWVEYYCQEMDSIVFRGMSSWIRNVGPDPQLLHAALRVLKDHAANTPDPANNVKAMHLLDGKREPLPRKDPHLVGELLALSAQVPWERERQLRLGHAAKRAWVGLLLQVAEQPAWKGYLVGPSGLGGGEDDTFSQLAARSGLPPQAGAGANVSARQWGQWIKQYDVEQRLEWVTGDPRFALARGQSALLVRLLMIATALYRVEHGNWPAQLEDLVTTGYLSAVPVDPVFGKQFGYRISQGEFIASESRPVEIARGQPVIVIENHGPLTSYPVPIWEK
jgi:hypothetical protein